MIAVYDEQVDGSRGGRAPSHRTNAKLGCSPSPLKARGDLPRAPRLFAHFGAAEGHVRLTPSSAGLAAQPGSGGRLQPLGLSRGSSRRLLSARWAWRERDPFLPELSWSPVSRVQRYPRQGLLGSKVSLLPVLACRIRAPGSGLGQGNRVIFLDGFKN